MKKIVISLILCLLVGLCSSNNVSATSNILSTDFINSIVNQIVLLEENISSDDIVVREEKMLYDIDNQENYVLVVTENNGYIIAGISNEAISEYSLELNSNPYKNYMDQKNLYYYGPTNYLYKTDDSLIDIYSNEEITLNAMYSYSISSDNEESLQQKNQDFLQNIQSISSTSRALNTWVGISESRFSRYNGTSWQNKDNICGPISASIMLAYYDDYIDNNTIPDSVRTRNSTSPGTLITKVKQETPVPTSTVPSTVQAGVNGFITKYSINKVRKASSGVSSHFATVKSGCGSNKPVCIGFLSSLGFPNGNHWSTVYQYKETIINSGYYKCVDTWGNYKNTFNSTWASGYVSLS